MTVQLSTVKPDFDDLVSQLQTALASKSAWIDILTTATGQTLTEFISAIGAFNQYSIESSFQEMFLDTAKLDSSIFGMTRTLGVRLLRKIPASVTVTLTRTGSTTYPLTITAFQQFSASTAKLFNRTAITFPAGSATVTATLYEGSIVNTSVTSSGGDFQSFISQDDQFSVSDTDVLVLVNGQSIPVVTDGLWHYPNNQSSVQDLTTASGQLNLLFGNQLYATRPTVGSVITIAYAVTKGIDGNDATFSGTTFSWDLNPDIVTGTATTSLTGGLAQRDAETYRKVSPLLFSGGERAVSKNDYEGMALSYPSLAVLDAKVCGQRELNPNDVRYMNLVRVTLLTTSTWTDQQFSDFLTWYEARAMYSTTFFRQDPIAIVIPVTATVSCANTVDLVAAKAGITNALQALFQAKRGILSRDTFKSDIYDTIKNAWPGVDYVQLSSPATDVYAEVAPVDNPTLTAVAGTLAPDYYTYWVTALGNGGETAARSPVNINLSATGGVQINWPASNNATGYKVYGRKSTTPPTAGLLATLGSGVLTFTDDGSISPTGSLNGLDNTGIHYPSLGAVSLTMTYTTRT